MEPCYAEASQGILRLVFTRGERENVCLGWPRHPKLVRAKLAEREGFEPSVGI